jgi:hypothetical protein
MAVDGIWRQGGGIAAAPVQYSLRVLKTVKADYYGVCEAAVYCHALLGIAHNCILFLLHNNRKVL